METVNVNAAREPPPFISTGDPASFAMRTIVERKPRIIQQVIDTNPLTEAVRQRLGALRTEIAEGVVASPLGAGVDPGSFAKEEWRAWEEEIARYSGHGWLDIPWYFAEALFYLKLLVAFGYYDRPSSRDPFELLKERELVDSGGGLDLARLLLRTVAKGGAAQEPLPFLLHAALWGNRVDLSNFEIDESHRRRVLVREADSLLIDHTDRVLELLRSARRVHMILDNAGSELACDLLVADRLLSEGAADLSLTLHVKGAPFFVSDAMVKDARSTIAAFGSDADPLLAQPGERLREALEAGRVHLADHWFWNSPLHFTSLPPDLRESLSCADMVIIKGDANYRRILEDRKWDFSLRMEEIAAYFPAPFVAIRTMKSEIVVDIPRDVVLRLSALDPEWLTNGRRGLIRFCAPLRNIRARTIHITPCGST